MATAFKTGTELVSILGDTIDSVIPTPANTSSTLVFADDRSITVDSTAAGVTHLLPDPQVQPGAVFEMKRINAAGNVVRFQAGVGHTIDGAAFFDLTNLNDTVKIISDDTVMWKVLSAFSGGGGVIEVIANFIVPLGIDGVDMTTGSSDKTVTLPVLADNLGRSISVSKADSASGNVIVDGNGTETINGSLTDTLGSQFVSRIYKAFPSEWRIL